MKNILTRVIENEKITDIFVGGCRKCGGKRMQRKPSSGNDGKECGTGNTAQVPQVLQGVKAEGV
ncbi:MAG: hypothetical protein IKC89_03195 [Lentisphaeria bacterium]|nr:hypothetical protein [Lentisphaeria bacterium]